jgi:NAD(P)-dependent dehydrogenase (short-subunit alcohol dehydrogenase family)
MGAACVERLAGEGARVFALDVDGAKAERLAARLSTSGAKVEALRADVIVESELTAALGEAEARAGRLDVLINIAGGSASGLLAELDSAVWDRLYALNVRSTVIACRTVLPAMRRQGAGAIVNMSSISGLRGDPGWAAYNSAKAAIINLTQSLASEEAAYVTGAALVIDGGLTARTGQPTGFDGDA